MKSTPIHIGEKIQSVMAKKGMSKAELARLLGIKPQSVDYLLKRKSIDTDTLYNLSLALNYDFSNLFQINPTDLKQINYDSAQVSAKISIEMTLSAEDIAKLNLKDRVVKVLNK